jgi:hypothetical protein
MKIMNLSLEFTRPIGNHGFLLSEPSNRCHRDICIGRRRPYVNGQSRLVEHLDGAVTADGHHNVAIVCLSDRQCPDDSAKSGELAQRSPRSAPGADDTGTVARENDVLVVKPANGQRGYPVGIGANLKVRLAQAVGPTRDIWDSDGS